MMKIILYFLIVTLWVREIYPCNSVQNAIRKFSKNLTNDIKSAYHLSLKKIKSFIHKISPIEKRRREIKKAFFQFTDKVFNKKNKKVNNNEINGQHLNNSSTANRLRMSHKISQCFNN